MLRALQVHNLALIESLEIEFTPGFTCLTGETGAGKSILLDAVGLLLGSRASVEMVRTGASKAWVEGVFDVSAKSGQAVAALLAEQGIDMDGAEVIVSRELANTGKTVARVNGRMVTAQFLRELGKHLAHQYGQHDSTVLLRKEEHIRLLDEYGESAIEPLLAAYQGVYKEYQTLLQTLREAEVNSKERAQKIDVLKQQINEIDAAKLKGGEEEALRARRSKLQHAERLRSVVDEAYDKVYEGAPRTPAMISELYRLARAVEAAVPLDAELSELYNYLDTAQVNLAEAAEFMRAYRERFEYDPDALARLEDRLAALEKLFRKYGENAEEVLAYRELASADLDKLERHEETMAELLAQKAAMLSALMASGERLTNARKQAAREFEERLKAELEALLMPNARIAVEIRPAPPHELGFDDVELFFSANRGEELKPLAKIASGGELSRLMLALAKMQTGHTHVGTLIFDEIDTGISGRAAQAVAEEMAKIANDRQVFCVTHQPQMACMATDHLLIEKTGRDARTITVLKRLTEPERIEELAKMIGGQKVTETTRTHARELLNRRLQVRP